ncbi:transposase [Streptosporangium sandarakinum]|uniref:transposase n=1 Tax=Streptosporangium sandarakinum TaxID=1260955 RepID=UPI00371A0E67
MLAEIGDDRARFAVARALKAYAGSAPITRASGKSLAVHHRKVKTSALAAELLAWTNPPGPGIPGHRAEFGVDGARLTCHQFSPVRPATPFVHPESSHAAEKYDAQLLT